MLSRLLALLAVLGLIAGPASAGAAQMQCMQMERAAAATMTMRGMDTAPCCDPSSHHDTSGKNCARN
ncbi:MAG: hypothetical protein ABI376_05070, partial [Caulobacteraceae bacterium]